MTGDCAVTVQPFKVTDCAQELCVNKKLQAHASKINFIFVIIVVLA
jgi:hypothetical protein